MGARLRLRSSRCISQFAFLMLRILGQKPSLLMPWRELFAAGSEAEPKLAIRGYEDEKT
ncbi:MULTISPECIES: hypothetical protein [Rhizobium]|uniref:Uncharacterized protein n=1 Tax=Rhizobium changzhiense TaxID=2692317 RepID=A0A7Z0RGW1_9HYPH|nr:MULTISPECIES: hypothetical protein [Rhizobium]MCW0016652.1 hypothetical protein [Rhizobium sp. BT-226]NZD61322.1 hypothetical protein [Rhizobium changzhiense]